MTSLFSYGKSNKGGWLIKIKLKMKKIAANQSHTFFSVLDIQSGDNIAFVGAGGKTSLMLASAEELFNKGSKVAVTTTTKMGTTEYSKHSEVIVKSDISHIILKVGSVLSKNRIPTARTYPHIKLIADNRNQKIDGLILGAGESRRFPGIKQCADIGGRTLLAHVTRQALNSNLDEIILVLGYKKYDVLKGLGKVLNNERLTIVDNVDYQNGISTSLKTGLKVLYNRSDAVMFILGDQPKITTELLNKLIDTYKYSNGQLCLPLINTSEGKRYGHPIIIGRKLYPYLLKIRGDIGGREIVKNYIDYAKIVELENSSSQFQINTENDLRQYRGAK